MMVIMNDTVVVMKHNMMKVLLFKVDMIKMMMMIVIMEN